MYAVGKVFYTVTGPFHPFGGAVDIVVVQQQDGSFKSSPWYVRFGKFQGVLKTREKVVNIAVNGVEAGFHMYLDSNGVAHFLRDADSNIDEGDFLVSPASSGDEREAPTQDAQLRKSKSTSCDISTMETNVGDDKILTKTVSRRSTILERMFGRKSSKNNSHAIERAEIAAELLDTKWSTNLSCGSKACSSNDEPSSSYLTDAGYVNQVETTKMVLPDCSFDHDKTMAPNRDSVDSNFGSPHRGRRDSGDGNGHCVQTTSVKEDVIQINGRKIGDLTDGITSTTDQSGSESLSNDLRTDKSINESIGTQGELQGNSENVIGGELVAKEALSHGIFEIHAIGTDITSGEREVISHLATVDLDGVGQNFTHTNSPTYSTRSLSSEKHGVSDGVTSATDLRGSESLPNDLSTDNSVNQSIDTQGDMRGNSEDFTGREMHGKEVLSHGIFEIHAIETDITNVKNELISHFVAVDSDGVDQNFTCTNSPPYISIGADLSSERHDVSFVASGQDACQEKVAILSSLETVESSYDMSNILADKICAAVGISLVDSIQFEEHSRVSCEKIEHVTFEERQLAYHGASSNKEGMHNLDVQDQEVSGFEDPSSQISKANVPDKDISVDTIANDHSTSPAHDLACQHDLVLDASSSVVETLSYMHEDPDNVIKYSTLETKTGNGELDVSVVQTSTMEDETTECIARSTNLPNKVEPEVSPVISDFSSLSKVEAENTKLEDDKNRYSSPNGVEIGLVAEEPRDEAEAVVSFSESVEDIQFQFSDTGNFADRKTVDDVIANKSAGAGVNDESDGDAEEKGGDETNLENKLETCSDLSRPETCLIPIPRSELHSDDNNLEVKSLPNLRSHINDLERSGSFQLSCSLQYNGENNGVDPIPEQEPEGTSDSKQNSGLPELINKPLPDDKNANDPRIDSFSPFVELSLCRHLLSEGMGADAACKAFDAEKVTLEKFRSMKESLIRNDKLVVRIAGRYFPWHVAAPVVLGLVSFREEQVFEPQGMIKVERVEPSTSQGGSWRRFWPISFTRTSTINIVQPVCDDTVEPCLSIPVKESDKEGKKPVAVTKRMERKVQSLTPTSEELASLNLREGKNVVTFTFSTAMLGRQQVDANIYLWKWNTRIVISDVDGTITKSDVLGQFMPMVGVDWSQNGVAHLFSAIKENGYQMLFLSARSISQAYLTRQFLFNLKQDGKALPDGPVVISPDGLFPSLYREVIRRAPHEFKISCLEAIKALFPPDSHPFYAGFGNRDTDEFSYLKVGIPMGKIFIVNPKGEVAVNRRVDTKSYTSLHALVNGMFPLISSSSEEEAYNNYNYWKMPLLTVD